MARCPSQWVQSRLSFYRYVIPEWAAMLQGDYWHSAAVDMGLVKAEEPSPEENPDEAAQDDSQSFTP